MAIEKLESNYVEVEFVRQIFCFADAERQHINCLIVLNEKAAINFMDENSLHPNFCSKERISLLCQDVNFKKHVKKLFVKKAKEKQFQSFEIPTLLFFISEPFTVENKCLTGAFKLCRAEIVNKFSHLFAQGLRKNEIGSNIEEQNTKLGDSKVSLAEKLKIIFCQVSGLKDDSSLTVEDTVGESGMDSIVAVQFVKQVQQKLEIEISVQSILSQPTFSELAQQITEYKVPTRDWNQTVDEIWEKECNFFPPKICRQIQGEATKNYFVTGVTGFVGSEILYQLLMRTEKEASTIFCLVRGKSEDECKQKIVEKLKLKWKKKEEEKQAERIVGICGDLSLHKFGMEENRWEEVCEKVEEIIHVGARVHSFLPFESLKRENVGGTIECLRMASEKKTKVLHFISTFSVLASLTKEEEDISLLALRKEGEMCELETINGYAQSKWVAERLVGKARQVGMTCSVWRLPMIAPNSNSGEANEVDWVIRFICGCVRMRVFPVLPTDTLEWLKVDICSQMICQVILEVAREKWIPFKAFHPVHPSQKFDLNRIFEWIVSFGYKDLKRVTYQTFAENLSKVDQHNPLFPFKESFSISFPHSPHKISSKDLSSLILFSSYHLTFEENDIHALLSYLVKQNLIDPPEI